MALAEYESVKKGAAFPNEIFHNIIASLMAEYLHIKFVEGETPPWSPFWTLPRVSKVFRQDCQTLNKTIFDLRPGDDSGVIASIFDYAMEWWDYVRVHPLEIEFPTIRGIDPKNGVPCLEDLTSSKSLIGIYICAGTAMAFFNWVVMRPIHQEKLIRTPPGYTEHMEGWERHYKIAVEEFSHYTRQYKMADNSTHHIFRSLQGALTLCDRVKTTVLLDYVAEYLGKQVPFIISMILVLKHAQDLEMDLVKEYSPPDIQHITADWTLDSLELLQDTDRIINCFLDSSPIVKTFTTPTERRIPKVVIKETRIMMILEAVINFKWEFYRDDVLESAMNNWKYFEFLYDAEE